MGVCRCQYLCLLLPPGDLASSSRCHLTKFSGTHTSRSRTSARSSSPIDLHSSHGLQHVSVLHLGEFRRRDAVKHRPPMAAYLHAQGRAGTCSQRMQNLDRRHGQKVRPAEA